MRKRKIAALPILITIIFTGLAGSVSADAVTECRYIHLILTGKAHTWLPDAEFDGIRLPVYVGYLKITSKSADFVNIDGLSFVRKTDLPIDTVNKALEDIIRTRSIEIIDGIKSKNYSYADKDFLYYLAEMLYNLGVEKIITERYINFYFQHEFPPPVLNAEDFEYAETCVYRPTATPPERCEALRLITLANQDALDTKVDERERAYSATGD